MTFASRLGAWRIGTRKDTTGTTADTTANMGCVAAVQTFKRDYAGTTTAGRTDVLFALPAGAQIIDILVDTLVGFTGSTAANLQIGDGVTADQFWATTNVTTAGRAAYTNARLGNWAGAATAAAPHGAGVGPTPVLVVATMTPTVATATAGTVQYTVLYTVRAATGAQGPVAG